VCESDVCLPTRTSDFDVCVCGVESDVCESDVCVESASDVCVECSLVCV